MARPAGLEPATSWFVAVNPFVDPTQLTAQETTSNASHLDPILDPSEDRAACRSRVALDHPPVTLSDVRQVKARSTRPSARFAVCARLRWRFSEVKHRVAQSVVVHSVHSPNLSGRAMVSLEGDRLGAYR
jgi:hypothetical protein